MSASRGRRHRAAHDRRARGRVGLRRRRVRVAVLREPGLDRRREQRRAGDLRRAAPARARRRAGRALRRRPRRQGARAARRALRARRRGAPARRGHRRRRDDLLPARRSRAARSVPASASASAARRCSRRRSSPAASGRGCRTRCSRARGSASAPDSSRRRPAAARSACSSRYGAAVGVRLRLPAQPVVLAVHARRADAISRSCPARRSSRTCTATSCSTSRPRSAGTPAARSPTRC